MCVSWRKVCGSRLYISERLPWQPWEVLLEEVQWFRRLELRVLTDSGNFLVTRSPTNSNKGHFYQDWVISGFLSVWTSEHCTDLFAVRDWSQLQNNIIVPGPGLSSNCKEGYFICLCFQIALIHCNFICFWVSNLLFLSHCQLNIFIIAINHKYSIWNMKVTCTHFITFFFFFTLTFVCFSNCNFHFTFF